MQVELNQTASAYVKRGKTALWRIASTPSWPDKWWLDACMHVCAHVLSCVCVCVCAELESFACMDCIHIIHY